MKYRPDIDGLRAVAVLSVLVYHAGFERVGGGFVGVDVFFVISGYLITRIIIEEIDRGEFSLWNFYERRVRRILPALFAMIAVTTVLATIFLVPSTLMAYGRSAAAAALSASNILFWRTTGYFDLRAPYSPLLHTWSLGVEEQFYLVVPLYLVVARKLLKWPWAAIIAPVFVASLMISIWQARESPSAAFYLPFGRMWELAMGGLLAAGFPRRIENGRLNDLLALAGLGAILAAALTYEETMRFPGESALLPCLGAALVIYAGGPPGQRQTLAARLLSLRPVVFVGLISYSLYLWHWPAFVFARILLGHELTRPEALGVATLSVGLAVLSWRYVERPFRRPRIGATADRRPVFAAAAAGMAACLVFGAIAWGTGGLPGRFSPEVLTLATATGDTNPRRKDCDSPSLRRIEDGALCVIGAPGRTPSVAIVGDSFADAMMAGMDASARKNGVAAVVMTRGACPPLLLGWKTSSCGTFNRAVIAKIARSPELRTVVMIGRWSKFVEGDRIGAVSREPVYLFDEETVRQGFEENRRVFRRSVARTVRAYGPGKKVYIVAFIPEQATLVPQTATVRAILRQEPPLGVTRAAFERRQRNVRAIFADPGLPDFTLLDASMFLCNAEHCPVVAEGKALYADDNHPSQTGARRIHPLFDPAMR